MDPTHIRSKVDALQSVLTHMYPEAAYSEADVLALVARIRATKG